LLNTGATEGGAIIGRAQGDRCFVNTVADVPASLAAEKGERLQIGIKAVQIVEMAFCIVAIAIASLSGNVGH
jgi:hypothetical protein